MPNFQPGDDVIVTFEGHEARGVVLTHSRGNVMATIETDPEWDYGSISNALAPYWTVCVRERNVRERLGADTPGVSPTPES